MAQDKYKASAPGTIFLAGEHAVLRGYRALTAAVDQRLYVSISPRNDNTIHIRSNLGGYQTDIHSLNIEPPFQFVLAVLKHLPLPIGLNITIESELSHTVGLGSSAAVTVATLHACHQWLNLPIKPDAFFQVVKTIIQDVQGGKGSGADIAACIYGGVIAYRMDPLSIEHLKHLPPVSLVYSGSKLPTPEAIALVNSIVEKSNGQVEKTLFPNIENITEQMIQAINIKDWNQLGKLCSEHQSQMQQADLSTQQLDDLIEEANQNKNIYGSKISGSGFGDCIVTIGELLPNCFPSSQVHNGRGIYQINISLSSEGVRHESN